MQFKSYAQNFEDVMLWRAFRNLDAGFYIDVGANDPEMDSVTLAFYERGWRGINIEPVAEQSERLSALRPRDVNLRMLAGAGSARRRFYVFPATGLSTQLREQAEIHCAAGLTMHEEMISEQRLSDICDRHAPSDIHFLKIDVEGAERDVLMGANFARHRPRVVLVEATRPCSQEPTHDEWEPILLNADYRFVYFDGLNRFYVAGEHHVELARCFASPPNVFDEFVCCRFAMRTLSQPVGSTSEPRRQTVPAPLALDLEGRVAMTARCRDADPIPKVAGAGAIHVERDGTRIQLMHNGLKVLADGYYGPWMTDLIRRCNGHHEPQEERIFHEVISRLGAGGTMIELGGYWAYYSLWYVGGAPERRAIVVEPDPAHRAVGQRNATLNGLDVEFISAFAGRVSTAPALFRTETSGVIALPCLSLPQLMLDHQVDTLEILHCDAQGAELAVLESCVELLRAGRIGWVFVSTHAHPISGDPLTHQRCLALLRNAGGTIEVEHDVYESFSGDGLIVARFTEAPANWEPPSITRNRYCEGLYRNPLYDLEECLSGFDPEKAEAVVTALYESLLLRAPDEAGLASHTEHLRRDGDVQGLVERFLKSGEFGNALPAFLRRYGAETSQLTSSQSLIANSWWERSGLVIRLKRNGALGRRGDRVLLPNDDVILPAVLASETWQPQLIGFLFEEASLDPRSLFLDLGANAGLISRQALLRLPSDLCCLCVEPDAENFEALRFNLAQFGSRARLFNHGLGMATGVAVTFRDRNNAGNISLNVHAMRGRPFDSASVAVVETTSWMNEAVPDAVPLLWKSDTQGFDEAIIASTSWSVWERVRRGVVELWRIEKPTFDRMAFRARIDRFPNRSIGGTTRATTDDVMDYIKGNDGAHEDLYLWR